MYLEMNKDFGAVSSDYYEVDASGSILCRGDADKRWIPGGTMFRKDCLIDIGLYDPGFKLLEDEELRYRFKQKYNIHRIPLPLYRYCRHDSNSTLNHSLMDEYSEKLLEKHPELRTIAFT